MAFQRSATSPAVVSVGRRASKRSSASASARVSASSGVKSTSSACAASAGGDVLHLGRGGAVVERQRRRGGEVPDRLEPDLHVLGQDLHVGLVERVLVAVPPPRVGAAAGPRPLVGMAVGQERVGRERRQAVGQERLVGGAHRPEHRRVGLSGRRRDHARAEALELRRGVPAVVGGRALHARRVDVVVADAAVGEIGEEGVGVPRAAAVAAVRVPGPPAQAHAARQVRALAPQQLGQFQHAGVAGGVVGDALVPRTVVRADQHEPARLARARDAHLGELRPVPAGLHGGVDLDLDAGAAGDHRRQRLARLPVHRDGDHRRQPIQVIELRGAPDRRADHVVDDAVLVREHDPRAPGLAGLEDGDWRRQAVHQRHLALGRAEPRTVDQHQFAA